MDFVKEPRERRVRIKALEQRIDVYKILQQRDGLDSLQLTTFLDDLKDLEKLRRIERAEYDTLYFMYEYFSDDGNPDNEQNLIPFGTNITDAPHFHGELCGLLNVVSNKHLTARIAWAAPRGHAKSAYLSNCFPVHEIVFSKRKYILVISETDTASKKFIEWVASQLKFNAKLREDFGDFLNPRKAMNDKDNQEAFLTANGVLVEAASMGKQLRGKRNGSYRPDLVICDDLESSKNTNTPELRGKNLDWFNKVVMPIGDPSRTSFIYMGTIVHPNGLLPSVLRRADFQSKIYAAIVSNPEREDLWQTFEEMYRDQDNDTRLDDTIAFYVQNSVEMDKGAEVLWAARFPYMKLMLEKVNIGSRAFGSEFMNNPIDDESQIFKPDMFTYFDYKDINPRELDYYGAWDIAFGKSARSDYNAIVIVGRHRKSGICYVMESWAKKCAAHEAVIMAADLIEKYRAKVFVVETVQAQIDFYRQLLELLSKRRIYGTKIKPLNSKKKKEERIESLEPIIENGQLRFQKVHRLMLEMFEQFPQHDHDDLPDALQMAVELCAVGKRRTYAKKPAGL